MPLPQINRPPLNADKRKELETYLLDHYERAEAAREVQVEKKFTAWQRIYDGIPLEKSRNVPWYNSSNFVVKLVQIYADTFLARTLNILFATKPLYTIEGFPKDVREGLEAYFNMKAIRDWKHYSLARQMIHSGNKNGTAPLKTIWRTWDKYIVSPEAAPGDGALGKQLIMYDGPQTKVIPFEDWNCYPITVGSLDDVVIKFHKLRYVEEVVRRRIDEGKWQFGDSHPDNDTGRQEIDGFLKRALIIPDDAKREKEQQSAGIEYQHLQELQAVECHLDYPVTNSPDRYYSIVALIIPSIRKMVDCWFDEYPEVEKFSLYRPFPREDLIFGQSIAEKLDQAQEEASSIHNDRRNNAILANSVMFKVRAGASGVPNSSTNYYPGKVWILEDLDDMDVFNNVGRNYDDMIQEEQFTMSLAGQLVGTMPEMVGASSGSTNKKGQYNAAGTLGMMSEGTQRADTNIRDVRLVMSEIARVSWILQSQFGADDPLIDTLAPEHQDQVRQAFQLMQKSPALARVAHFETQASDAGANKEIRRQNLMQMAQTLGQYGQAVIQLTTQRMSQPALQPVIDQVITMTRSIAQSLLRAFDEGELEEVLPDVAKALSAAPGGQPGGSAPGGPGGPGELPPPPGVPGGQVEPGGGGNPNQPFSLQDLCALAQVPGGAAPNVR